MDVFVSNDVQYDFVLKPLKYFWSHKKFHLLFPEKQSLEVTSGDHLLNPQSRVNESKLSGPCPTEFWISLFDARCISFRTPLCYGEELHISMIRAPRTFFPPDCKVPMPCISPHIANVPVPRFSSMSLILESSDFVLELQVSHEATLEGMSHSHWPSVDAHPYYCCLCCS